MGDKIFPVDLMLPDMSGMEVIKAIRRLSTDSQFEYNTYIRDFFADNQGKSLKDAIKCWKYKKSLQGHNRYEPSDLIALS